MINKVIEDLELEIQNSSSTYKSKELKYKLNFFKRASLEIPEYDYSKVEYKGVTTKIILHCIEHGKFEITPQGLFRGGGCPTCTKRDRRLKSTKSNDTFIKQVQEVSPQYDYSKVGVRKTQEKYIEEVSKLHPEYDFSNTIYQGSTAKLIVECLKHGEFEIDSSTLLRGGKCSQCNWEKARGRFRKNLDTFLEEVKLLHPTYDFSKVEYTNSYTKVEVICSVHGSFYSTPTSLLKGCGCNICGKIKAGLKNEMGKEEYLERVYKKLKEVNPTLKVYEDTFINKQSKITIECETHGVMEIEAMALERNKLGCPKCGTGNMVKTNTTTFEELEQKAFNKFGKTIKLYKNTYVNFTTKMTCECHIHGKFKVEPTLLINKSKVGCPKCARLEGGKKRGVPYETFLKKANKKFKGKFTYLEDTYKGSTSKMITVCPQHGTFEIIPSYHIRRMYGCKKCAIENSPSYKPTYKPYYDKPTTLYYIKLIKDNEEYFKLGITTTTLDKRFNRLPSEGLTYEILLTKTFEKGRKAYFLEQRLLHQYNMNKIDFILLPKSGGNSEIFNQDIYESIKQYFD